MLREEVPSAPPKNIVASGRTNQSIMVQWQPPPELQLNGVLRGYVLRYLHTQPNAHVVYDADVEKKVLKCLYLYFFLFYGVEKHVVK